MNGERVLSVCGLLLGMLLAAQSGCERSDEPGTLYREAQQLFDRGLHGLAAQRYEQYALSDPEAPDADAALYKAAFLYAYYLSDDLRAIELFHRLTALYPDSDKTPSAHENLAEIYRTHLKQIPQAVAQYERLRDLRRSRGEEAAGCYYEMSRCYLEMGDLEKARAMSERTLRESPEGPYAERATYQIGTLHYLEGNYDEAAGSLEYFLETYPESEWQFDAMLHRARALEKLGKTQESESLFARMEERYPGKMALVGKGE